MMVVTFFVIGYIAGMICMFCFLRKMILKKQNESLKHLGLYKLMNDWLCLKQEGKSLVDFFRRNKYQRIAVYGMSCVGERLLDELEGTDIKVAYAIDRNAKNIFCPIELITPDEKFGKVDAVIVTSIFYFSEIEDMLINKGIKCPILSIEDIIWACFKNA